MGLILKNTNGGFGRLRLSGGTGRMNVLAATSSTPPSPTFDADAQAFITAAAITDPTQQSAVNTLVVSLKDYSIWTKMKALYPFVGGTASQHKFNLKNPLDTDAAFRLVFNGGWTHSSNGALPNGTNAYADTKITPSLHLTLNSTHASYYSRTSGASGYAFGAMDVGQTNRILLQLYPPIFYASVFVTTGNYYEYTGGSSLAMLTVNRNASNVSNIWQNNIKKATSTLTPSSLTLYPIFIGANNSAGAGANFFFNGQCAFSSIGDGLTDTEYTNFYTAVQAFQTSLSRNV